MKYLITLVCLFSMICGFSSARDLNESEKKVLLERARIYEDARNSFDPDKILLLTPASVERLPGGSEDFAKRVRSLMKNFKAAWDEGSVRCEKSKLGEPGTIYLSGANEVCFVPKEELGVSMKQDILKRGYLVAVREKGKSWCFIDSYIVHEHPDALAALFPGLPADVALPTQKVGPRE